MLIGLTKARFMGPVADAVEQAGGSLARVFRRAEMPLRLIEEPDRLILLRDQLRIVECAAREIGDAALPARLSASAGVPSLGPYGVRVCASDTLGEALALGTALIVGHLQSATQMAVVVAGGRARVTYHVTDTSDLGRQKNEVLALGYILDVLRRFLGKDFVPDEASISGAVLQDRTAIETALGCAVRLGPSAAVSFDTRWLEVSNPRRFAGPVAISAQEVPEPNDFLLCIAHLIRFDLLEGRPTIDRLCRRLGLSRRTLQRRFEAHGTTFAAYLMRELEREARHLLATSHRPIGRIALDLGYSDAAHFSRAFHGWTGMPPRVWRQVVTGFRYPP